MLTFLISFKGDLDGAAEHFRDISYVQSAESLVETGKAVIEGDWKKLAESAGENAVGIAAGFIPGIGRRGKRGKRGKHKKVDKEVKKETHSEHRDKRSTDHDERKRENENQGKKKECKVNHRSRRAAKKRNLI